MYGIFETERSNKKGRRSWHISIARVVVPQSKQSSDKAYWRTRLWSELKQIPLKVNNYRGSHISSSIGNNCNGWKGILWLRNLDLDCLLEE